MMFGISSAPELHQHTIQQALERCEGDYNIHDDIITHGRTTIKKHAVRLQLRKILKPIPEIGRTLNRDKCAFRMSKLTFVGYILPKQGKEPTQLRVEAVMDTREP